MALRLHALRAALLCAASAACSAPDLDDAPDRGPAPSPAELRADAEGRDAPPTPTPSPAEQRAAAAAEDPGAETTPPPPAPSTATPPTATPPTPALPTAAAPRTPPPLRATPERHLPEPPFTAWTTSAPLTLVAGRGQPTTTLKRLGVRVEVLAVEGERMRARCVGCLDEDRDAEGWLQSGAVRAARAPGGSGDALDVMLSKRAGWAGGRDLPSGATNVQLCALIDAGFELSGDQATWSVAGGAATMAWTDGRWRLVDLQPPAEPPPATCRADGRPKMTPSPAEGR